VFNDFFCNIKYKYNGFYQNKSPTLKYKEKIEGFPSVIFGRVMDFEISRFNKYKLTTH